jgi:RNA polymerase sigma-70 factor (ECF subfamily)
MERRHSTPDVEALLGESSWVHGLVARLSRDAAAAEDVVQDTWVAALESPAPLDARGESGLRAWLAAVARNLALKRRTQEDVRRRHERAAARAESRADVDPLDQLGRLQLQRALADALLALDEPYRTAVVSRYLDGLGYDELARREEISRVAARQRVSRGLALLRGRLERAHGPGGTGEHAFALLLAAFGAHSARVGALPGTVAESMGGILLGTKTTVGVVVAAAVLTGVVVLGPWSESERREDPPAVAAREPSAPAGAAGEAATDPDPGAPASVRVAAGEIGRAAGGEERRGLRATAVLRVAVVDREGRPVSGAVLGRALEDGRPAGGGVTDDAGRVDLVLPLEPGGLLEPQRVHVGHERFVPASFVPGGPPGEEHTVVLAALPWLELRLLDEEGVPITAGAAVRIVVQDADPAEEDEGRSHHDAVRTPDGVLRLPALPVGRMVRLRAGATGFIAHEEEVDLLLRGDDGSRMEVVLQRGVTVRGIVLDAAAREPMPGANVWADSYRHDMGWMTPRTTTDDAGRFVLEGVEAKPHETEDGHLLAKLSVYAESDGHSTERLGLQLHTWNDAGEYEMELLLEPTSSHVTGTVRWPDGEPAPLVYVHAIDALHDSWTVMTDQEGGFALSDLAPGDLHVLVRSGGIAGDEPLSAALLRTQIGPDLGEHLELELVSCTQRIAGRVVDVDGQPVEGLAVTLRYRHRADGLTMGIDGADTRTDAEGRYAFEGLPPGAFGVYAWPEEGLARLPESHTLDLELGEDAEERDFVVGPGVVFGGHVELAPGARERNWLVLTDIESGEVVHRDRLAQGGAFELPPTLAGVYELAVERDGATLASTLIGPAGAGDLFLRAQR